MSSRQFDRDTKDWIIDASDERAAAAGCVMDLEMAAHHINWIEENCCLYEGEGAGDAITLMDWQKAFLTRLHGWRIWSDEWNSWVRRFRKAALWAPKKNGKPVHIETLVPTTRGMVRMADLTTADSVFDETGSPTRIIWASEVMHDRKCYRILFGGSVEVIAADDHIWPVEVVSRKRDETRGQYVEVQMMTEEIAEIHSRNARVKMRVKVPGPTQTPDVALPVDPYWLGFWLGNGKREKARGDLTIRTSDAEEILAHLIAGEGMPSSNWDNPGESRHYYFSGMAKRLTLLGLRGQKRIPEAYLNAGTSQRWALLQGLMDSDGCISTERNQCKYSTSDPELRDGVIRLLSSLGFKATWNAAAPTEANRQTKDNFCVLFTGRIGQPIARLARKLANLQEAKEGTRAQYRQIVACEPCDSVPVRCITVEAKSHLFLLTEHFIPTHNSPFGAALGLDLLINDDEMGQKIYNGAKNGDQAKISQMHAVMMVRQSPRLDAECQIFKNTLEIWHQPTNSRMSILTGDNSRGQKAKEGLNGSVFFDEMHVVDRGLYETVSRAGISRRQPLEFSGSTAGDDPSAVGRERYEYGRQVARGDRDDIRFLHVEYGVDDGVKEVDIVRDPEKYGAMANPSWGVIIKPSEFVADLNNSKGRQREMAKFMQYRCNVWIGSANRWLDPLAWSACGRDIDLDELKGRECYLGVDLARRLDMAAAVFAFDYPEAGEDGILFWPMLWLPEATAKKRDILFPFITWGLEGYLNITPGETLNYDFIKRDIRKFVNDNELQILNLYFDVKYANEFTQSLVEGETDGEGNTILEGFGCDRTEFPQNITHLTGPSVELERRILNNSVRHPNNAVLDWMIGHCEVWTDRNQNIRPVKPEPHSGKSIDGVVAMIMALYGVDTAQRNMPRVHG